MRQHRLCLQWIKHDQAMHIGQRVKQKMRFNLRLQKHQLRLRIGLAVFGQKPAFPFQFGAIHLALITYQYKAGGNNGNHQRQNQATPADVRVLLHKLKHVGRT